MIPLYSLGRLQRPPRSGCIPLCPFLSFHSISLFLSVGGLCLFQSICIIFLLLLFSLPPYPLRLLKNFFWRLNFLFSLLSPGHIQTFRF